jgi:hypothetical protein
MSSLETIEITVTMTASFPKSTPAPSDLLDRFYDEFDADDSQQHADDHRADQVAAAMPERMAGIGRFSAQPAAENDDRRADGVGERVVGVSGQGHRTGHQSHPELEEEQQGVAADRHPALNQGEVDRDVFSGRYGHYPSP